METPKYSVNTQQVSTIISWIKAKEIAIPEIQRPFVWDASKVRDLIDSLYQEYPVGYLIIWKNPNIKLKDGRTSEGKKILIDGQQRVIAVRAALLGSETINKDYRKVRIKISFNPLTEKFDVSDAATLNDPQQIYDISQVFQDGFKINKFVNEYCEKNSIADHDLIFERIENLKQIQNKTIGVIDLSSELAIDTVTEIFVRINSQGIVLSQADFAMSKIASTEKLDGDKLRKCIDYFCHLSVDPTFYLSIKENDSEFAKTDYFQKMSWLENETDDLFDPTYTDVLRVAFTSEFGRGKLADLVSLLSGRNFVTKSYEEIIQAESFNKLALGVSNFISESNFKNLLMIIKSAGFISPDLLSSNNSVDFAYIGYLTLRKQHYPQPKIESLIKRWFVMSVLTGRYSSSPESTFDEDIKNITSKPFEDYLSLMEQGQLSSAFWDVSLPEKLITSSINSPYFNVFLASLIKTQVYGFLAKDVLTADLISIKGDIHHIFPKSYLKKNGLSKTKYNQVANYVYMQSETNVRIGNKSPKDYLSVVIDQFGKDVHEKICNINSREELYKNFSENCTPEDLVNITIDQYDEFLEKRRILMAQKIREYYFSL